MLGDKVTARRCHEIGLATSVTADDHLADHVSALAQRLAETRRSPTPPPNRC